MATLQRREELGTLANDQLATFLVTRLCRPVHVFLDVGAHIGSIIAEVASHCPSVRIVAFEAMPDKVQRLRRMFPQVECHACAVSEADAETSFFVNRRLSGYSSLAEPRLEDRAETTEIKVPMRRIDGLLDGAAVDVIKIDVEGAELGVLRGAERVIGANRPTVMFESGPTSAQSLGYPKEALWLWFADRRYEVFVPNRVAHNGPGLTLDGFLESHLYPRRTTNYIAVARERRDELRDRARHVLGMQPS